MLLGLNSPLQTQHSERVRDSGLISTFTLVITLSLVNILTDAVIPNTFFSRYSMNDK